MRNVNHFVLAAMASLGIVAYVTYEPPINPDPNHTHADFAVWMDGEKLGFSGPEFMSESEGEETDDNHEVHGHKHHPYLHLHDGNGHVIHRHKPGLSLREFLRSIGIEAVNDISSGAPCIDPVTLKASGSMEQACLRLFVNGTEIQPRPGADLLEYVFDDLDQILITDTSDDSEIDQQLSDITEDACLYSKTCPERGKPPVENCIADPAVPCVSPLD